MRTHLPAVWCRLEVGKILSTTGEKTVVDLKGQGVIKCNTQAQPVNQIAFDPQAAALLSLHYTV